MKKPKYFTRGNQYWKQKQVGSEKHAILINLPKKNYHYDGDAHIFFNTDRDYLDLHTNAKEISEAEFEAVRTAHIKRLQEF